MTKTYEGRYGWGEGRNLPGTTDGPAGCELLIDGVVTDELVDWVDTVRLTYRIIDLDYVGQRANLQELPRTLKTAEYSLVLRDKG